MMHSAEITNLCKSWWDTVADATPEEQRRHAERFLELLGWRPAAPLESRPTAGHVQALSYVLRAESRTSIGAHFVLPGALNPPSLVLERGLDFCEVTRLLANDTRALHLDYAFITDMRRSYLYDVRSDELLRYADKPSQFETDVEQVLRQAEVAAGALEEARRQPRSIAARQLREWCQRWAETLELESRLTEDEAGQVLDRLLVLRFLFDHAVLKRAGWDLRKAFGDLVARAFRTKSEGCGQAFVALNRALWNLFKADLFAPSERVDKMAGNDAMAGPLLRDFALLSRTKFSIATILESFNYGEAIEKALVRMIPDINEERDDILARQTLDTVDHMRIAIDIRDEGYRAIFHWFDRLVDAYARLGVEFDAQARQGRGRQEHLDLLAWSELDAGRPSAVCDRFRHVIEQGLTMYYSSPRQQRTARLMLYLHLISRCDQAGETLAQFPRIEAALARRPHVLESDRRRIFQPSPPEAEWEVM